MNGVKYKGYSAVKLTFHGEYQIYMEGKLVAIGFTTKKAVRAWIDAELDKA